MSGTGIDVVPKLPKNPVPLRKSVPAPPVQVFMSYRLPEVSGTGFDAELNLLKSLVPVIPAVYTACKPWCVAYRTHPCFFSWLDSA